MSIFENFMVRDEQEYKNGGAEKAENQEQQGSFMLNNGPDSDQVVDAENEQKLIYVSSRGYFFQ